MKSKEICPNLSLETTSKNVCRLNLYIYIYISQFVGGLPVVSLRFCDSVASARSDVPAPRSGNSAEGGRVEGLPGKYQGPLVNGHPYPKPR